MLDPSPNIDPAAMQLRGPSQDWVDERCTYLGATDVAAIMRLHPYITPLNVYQDKKGLAPQLAMNQAMVHGQNLELYVARLYSKCTGRKLHKSKLYRDKRFPHFACNPDYEIRGERPLRLLECKTAGYWGGQIFGEQGDAVPDQYLIQCMWQLAITGRQVCNLGVLIGGQDFRIYTIERDEDVIRELRAKADEWWQTYILSDCPPPLTGDKPDTQWVKDEYPSSVDGNVLYAPPVIDDMCIELRTVREGVKALSSEQARLENEIKHYMKEAAVLESSAGQITWKSSKSGSRSFCCKFKEVSKICQTAA